MATYYVGIGGNNGNNGTTWALRKLTLNGAEDIPVVAGDTVYVGPGTYREQLTLDVSGTEGNPITYIGDYSGANTDGVGGVVRITGSDNDQTAARTNCIVDGGGRDYRTFRGFLLDTPTAAVITANGNTCTNWIIDQCCFMGTASQTCITCNGSSATWTIKNCAFYGANSYAVYLTNASTFDNAAINIENCLFINGGTAVGIARVGGCTLKNCTVLSRNGVQILYALSVGQTTTVNNCTFTNLNVALNATATGEITENYNCFWANSVDRTNIATGANSNTYPPLFDSRWFFELIGGKSRMLLPFDLASYSQLVNVAGTSPTTTDMRGTAVIGAQREWGALEYDPALLFRRVIGRNDG